MRLSLVVWVRSSQLSTFPSPLVLAGINREMNFHTHLATIRLNQVVWCRTSQKLPSHPKYKMQWDQVETWAFTLIWLQWRRLYEMVRFVFHFFLALCYHDEWRTANNPYLLQRGKTRQNEVVGDEVSLLSTFLYPHHPQFQVSQSGHELPLSLCNKKVVKSSLLFRSIWCQQETKEMSSKESCSHTQVEVKKVTGVGDPFLLR